jgi:hypothetical protein
VTNLEQRITLTAKMFSNIKDEKGKEKDEVNKEIRIVFEDGVNPKTDGKTIYLPTNMNEERLWELLGALLHESLHIRFTDFDDLPSDFKNNPGLFHCLNTLEDMRINWKAFQIFPKTQLFFHALYFYLAQNKKAELLNEPISFQIIKTLLLSNEDFPVYSEKAVELIAKHDIGRFQTIARKAKSVRMLEQPARELYALLNDIAAKELNDLTDSELSEMLKKIKENLEKKIREKQKEYQNLKDILVKLRKEHNELCEESRKWHRREATNNTRSQNLNREAGNLDTEADNELQQNHQQQSNNLRNQANHKRKLSDAASYRADEASVKLSDVEQKQTDLRQKIDFYEKLAKLLQETLNELKQYLNDLLKNGTESETCGFGYSPVSINGLDALTKSDLVYEKSYILPKSLEGVIREVFLKKKEEKEIDDEGNRMNRKNLYRIITDNQNLFEIPIQPFDKTKVAFLLDASGSMGGSRAKLVNTAFAHLYNSLNEVLIAEQLDVKIGVWSFDHNLYTLKDFEEIKTGEQIIEKYRPSGGTQILKNLQKVMDKMEVSNNNEKRIVILITDAEVEERELVEIKNNINFEDVKIVFLGVELTLNGRYGGKTAKELFMDNIETDSNVVHILTNALVRNL